MVSPLAASVFSIETASSLTSIGTSTCHCISIVVEFSTVPITLFRLFTTINGDFDVETLGMRGSPAMAEEAKLAGNELL